MNYFCLHTTVMLTACYINRQPGKGYRYSDTNACGESAASKYNDTLTRASNSRIVYMLYDDELYMLKSNKICVMLCYIIRIVKAHIYILYIICLEPCLIFFVFAKARPWALLSCVTCFILFYSGAFFYVEGRTRHILKLRQVSCQRLLITHLLRH